MGEWLRYNCAAGCFHMNKLCSRHYSIEIEFCFLNRFLNHPLGRGTWG